ncbi:MAG: putative ester cyclase, partial [Paracoccaceae bacterium]
MTAEALKSLIAPLRLAMADFAEAPVRAEIGKVFAPDATLNLCHPFGDLTGPDVLYDALYAPLFTAMPDLERRDMIVIAGTTSEGQDWVGTMGNYMGTFTSPYLGIPPTGHLAQMRYHEFYKLEAGQIVEMQAIWDIPELMMQADVWPLSPQLGVALCTPAPMTQDGLTTSGNGQSAMDRVVGMLTDLCRHPAEGGPEIMKLEHHW